MKRFSESDIIDAIGEIDEKYIRESERQVGFLPLVKYSSVVAACLAVALISGVALYSASKREDPPKPPVIVYTSTVQSSIPTSSATESETVSEKMTESVTESTTEVTTVETTTVTESETTIPVIPTETPVTPLPTEPEIPAKEPEESTEPEGTEEPATEPATESHTEVPAAPSDPVTSEPEEDPMTSSSVTFPSGTGVIIATDDDGAVDDTIAGIGTTPMGATSIVTEVVTEVVTSQVAVTEGENTSAPTGSVTTTGPSEDPDNYESEAPANGSSAGVSAHYLTKIPDWACRFEMPENTDADTVFANSTDIFSGDVVGLRSVEVKMNGKCFYLSIAEIKVTIEAFKSSSNIPAGSTVRILLPHGVNVSEENPYDSDDIAGLLGETEMHGGGFGIFCTQKITENDKLTYGNAYYPLSNIADYVLPDGMNYLILSNPYCTWFNSKTFSELYEIGGSLTNFNTAFDFFAEAKANGRL